MSTRFAVSNSSGCPGILPLSAVGTDVNSWEIYDSTILLKLCWFLMALAKVYILLLIVSSNLSLEATFLDIWSNNFDWPATKSLKGVLKLLLKLLPE